MDQAELDAKIAAQAERLKNKQEDADKAEKEKLAEAANAYLQRKRG